LTAYYFFPAQEKGKNWRMGLSNKTKLDETFPACRAVLDVEIWDEVIARCGGNPELETVLQVLTSHMGKLGLPEFLPELARLELTISTVRDKTITIPPEVKRLDINPTLHLLELTWKNLTLVNHNDRSSFKAPEPGDEGVLVWRHPKTDEVVVNPVTNETFLVLKMVLDRITPDDVAAESDLPVGAVVWAIDRATDSGLILAPRSLIRRDRDSFPVGEVTDEVFLESPFFTIQWHITQACDLHCKHCYDRSNRSPLELDQALSVLDDLRAFCLSRHVIGQVSFTGGNPLLCPHFFELYRAAHDLGFVVAILGNPTSEKTIETLCEIQKPVFYQVSLEGLQEHNDYIRGSGTFNRVVEFLPILRDFSIPSQVMLTLTKDNMNQVLPLAEQLRHLTDTFNFNRLSQVGEGVNLFLPTRDEYISFLEEYLNAAEYNPIMGLKDNLFNIIRTQRGLEPFGGCAGHGCSAAFNFIAILPDGEVHACRKFPSLIGNISENSFADIYDSEMAQRYRSGTNACRSCSIRPICGGCLAVVHGLGFDIFEERDPYCFIDL
jgi:selenobiotic family peptide radical SAM maturase